MAVVAWTMTPRSANFSVINSTKFEEAVNVVRAQSEKNGKDVDGTMSYLGQKIMKKIANPALFIGKIESKNYQWQFRVPFPENSRCRLEN